ncbi:hypothetical protein PR048_021889 [Dryococelus australis]|uniref:Uncharacterized protein n=1 Tax=Dryococelus australis TaxID=614101 RepID=A0ABQ9GZI7_9NEOP|nr:hypothetical protein PR048_021889 [Dryococelus australis]
MPAVSLSGTQLMDLDNENTFAAYELLKAAVENVKYRPAYPNDWRKLAICQRLRATRCEVNRLFGRTDLMYPTFKSPWHSWDSNQGLSSSKTDVSVPLVLEVSSYDQAQNVSSTSVRFKVLKLSLITAFLQCPTSSLQNVAEVCKNCAIIVQPLPAVILEADLLLCHSSAGGFPRHSASATLDYVLDSCYQYKRIHDNQQQRIHVVGRGHERGRHMQRHTQQHKGSAAGDSVDRGVRVSIARIVPSLLDRERGCPSHSLNIARVSEPQALVLLPIRNVFSSQSEYVQQQRRRFRDSVLTSNPIHIVYDSHVGNKAVQCRDTEFSSAQPARSLCPISTLQFSSWSVAGASGIVTVRAFVGDNNLTVWQGLQALLLFARLWETIIWQCGRGFRNRMRLERASQKQSSDTHEIPYDRVKRCWERKIIIKASERVDVDVFTENKRPCPQHRQTQIFLLDILCGIRRVMLTMGVGKTVKHSLTLLLPVYYWITVTRGVSKELSSNQNSRRKEQVFGVYLSLPYPRSVAHQQTASREVGKDGQTTRLPCRRNGFDSLRGHSRVSARWNRAARYSWLARISGIYPVYSALAFRCCSILTSVLLYMRVWASVFSMGAVWLRLWLAVFGSTQEGDGKIERLMERKLVCKAHLARIEKIEQVLYFPCKAIQVVILFVLVYWSCDLLYINHRGCKHAEGKDTYVSMPCSLCKNGVHAIMKLNVPQPVQDQLYEVVPHLLDSQRRVDSIAESRGLYNYD